MISPSRPLLRYHGGKWILAPWICRHLPRHRIYTEAFGGAASVLLRKAPAYSEVYNDLSGEVVNLFRVLRSPADASRLVALLRLAPFARAEFEWAYESAEDPVERARRLIVRSYMGFGSDAPNMAVRTGFRSNSNRSGSTPAHDWANYPDALLVAVDRLRDVIIEQRPAIEVMSRHDRCDCLHYVDPPYVPSTRSPKARKGGAKYHAYDFEMSDEDHVALADALRGMRGMVVLSGYPSALYERLYPDWPCVTRDARADGARARTECLWFNEAAWSALHGATGPLFTKGAA